MDQQTEIAIELLDEIRVLRRTLKIRMMDKLVQNDALSMLSTDQAIRFVLDTEPSISLLADDITAAENLLEEHLDYFFPMQSIAILINK
jgi:hypothetical protein